MFDRARVRNSEAWKLDSLSFLGRAGLAHNMAEAEAVVDSLNSLRIETNLWLLDDAQTRRLAQLSELYTTDLDLINQQLTLTQNQLVTDRARLALQVTHLEAELLSLWSRYDTEVAIQEARERALAADQSVTIKEARVAITTEKAFLEIDLLVARISLEEVELSQAEATNLRLGFQAEEVILAQDLESFRLEELEIDLIQMDVRLGEAELKVEREELKRDQVGLDSNRADLNLNQQALRLDAEDFTQNQVTQQSTQADLALVQVELRSDREDLEGDQIGTEELRADQGLARGNLAIAQEGLARDNVTLDDMRADLGIDQAELRMNSAELDLDRAELRRQELELQNMETEFLIDMEFYTQAGIVLDWKKIDLRIKQTIVSVSRHLYQRSVALLDGKEAEIAVLRIELRQQLEILRGQRLQIQASTLDVEKSELEIRKEEMGIQAAGIDVDIQRAGLEALRADVDEAVVGAQIDDILARKLLSLDTIRARALNIIEDKTTSDGQVLLVDDLHGKHVDEFDARFAALVTDGNTDVSVATDRKDDFTNQANNDEEIADDKATSWESRSTKGLEMEAQRKEEAYWDQVQSTESAETYAAADVTTKLIQTIGT